MDSLKNFHLYPNSSGKIEEVAIAFAIDGDEGNELEIYTSIYSNFIKEASTVKAWHVLVSEKYVEYVESMMTNLGKEKNKNYYIHLIEDNFSPWIQDAFVCGYIGEKDFIVSPKKSKRQASGARNDKNFAQVIAENSDYNLVTCDKLIFEGSDILATGDYVLFAYDSCIDRSRKGWNDTSARDGSGRVSLEEVEKRFKDLFVKSKQEVLLSSSLELDDKTRGFVHGNAKRWISMDHLDLFLTPLDNKQIAMADIYVPEYSVMSEKSIEYAKENVKQNKIEEEKLIKILQYYGFEVLRNRVPDLKGYGYAYYNNCQVEYYQEDGETIKKVYLPQYADSVEGELKEILKKSDEESVTFFENLKYIVHKINFHFSLSSKKGGLHCLTKILKRSKMIELEINLKLNTKDYSTKIVDNQLIFSGEGNEYFVNLNEKVAFRSLGNKIFRINPSPDAPEFIIQFKSNHSNYRITTDLVENHPFESGSYDGLQIGVDDIRIEGRTGTVFNLRKEVNLKLDDGMLTVGHITV